MNYKRLLKKTPMWRLFIQNFFYPIYNIIWQYVINFNAKLLYFFWFFKKREFIKFNKSDKILIKDRVSLECAHMFHTKCVVQLIRKRLRKCPLCRHRISWNINQLFTHEKLYK